MKIQQQIQKYLINPKKENGQHFIKNMSLLHREIEYAKIRKDDIVLEIGPGIGNLTELLVQKAKKVIAIEKDTQFKVCLNDLQKKYDNLEIKWGDALNVDFPPFNKVISNLPFKIALPLTFKLLNTNFDSGILVYQQKLAERLSASPGKKRYCRISVQVQRLANFKLLELIKKSAFYPPPEVDSAIIKIKRNYSKFDVPSETFFKRTLDFMFFKRTKSLKQVILSLKYIKNLRKELIGVLLELGDIQNKKIFQLTPKQFGEITIVLYQKKIKIPKIPNKLKRKTQKFI